MVAHYGGIQQRICQGSTAICDDDVLEQADTNNTRLTDKSPTGRRLRGGNTRGCLLTSKSGYAHQHRM